MGEACSAPCHRSYAGGATRLLPPRPAGQHGGRSRHDARNRDPLLRSRRRRGRGRGGHPGAAVGLDHHRRGVPIPRGRARRVPGRRARRGGLVVHRGARDRGCGAGTPPRRTHRGADLDLRVERPGAVPPRAATGAARHRRGHLQPVARRAARGDRGARRPRRRHRRPLRRHPAVRGDPPDLPRREPPADRGRGARARCERRPRDGRRSRNRGVLLLVLRDQEPHLRRRRRPGHRRSGAGRLRPVVPAARPVTRRVGPLHAGREDGGLRHPRRRPQGQPARRARRRREGTARTVPRAAGPPPRAGAAVPGPRSRRCPGSGSCRPSCPTGVPIT
jgi:hypothetical protein